MKKNIWFGSILILAIVIGWNIYTPKFNRAINAASFSNYDVTVYRDTWGVPHIFGEKDKDTAYGLGYAHSEDDFKTIQDILLALRGKLATVHGKDAAANDYMVHLLRI